MWQAMPLPRSLNARRRMQYVWRRALVATFFALAAIALPRAARADEVGSVEWSKFYAAAESVMRGKFVREEPTSRASQSSSDSGTSSQARTGAVGTSTNPWFGVDPHVSVVARDWGEGFRLYGAPMALSDQLRLTRSSRMIMSRVRMGNGRIVPFMQLGMGQWRVDTSTLPAMHYDIQIASHAGWGIEAHLAKNFDLVAESSTTFIMRDSRDPGSLPATRIFGAAFFSRLTF
jgi:hypothetical protein